MHELERDILRGVWDAELEWRVRVKQEEAVMEVEKEENAKKERERERSRKRTFREELHGFLLVCAILLILLGIGAFLWKLKH